MTNSKSGFTLIELLVVVAIIGTLASVVLVSLDNTRGKARDSVRKTELDSIAKALELYYLDCEDYRVRQNCSSGSYYGAGGVGWFNYNSYGGTAGSVGLGLSSKGYISSEPIDPSGAATGNIGGRSGYMIYANQDHYTIWANLESPSTADTTTLINCHFSQYDAYHSSYPASARANYCVSN